MRFIFITNMPELASFVTARGINRVMVDLELIGKVERQGHLSTVISRHSFEDVANVRRAIPGRELMVRLNPVHDGSSAEIEKAISLGADVLMLPMFRTAEEVARFAALVNGRVRICLLLETAAGVDNLQSIVATRGVDEVHVGLNDLHLDLGLDFMFEPLSRGLVDSISTVVRGAGLPFGIGGLARAGEGLLPADLLVGEHVRLQSTGAILSRTFHRNCLTVAEIQNNMDFTAEVEKLQQAYALYSGATPETLLQVHRDVGERVASIVKLKKAAG